MEQFVRTWWTHTASAVKRGEPADRRFAVVAVVRMRNGKVLHRGQRGYETAEECLLAWKCEDRGNGLMWHPAYGECSVADVDAFVRRGANGSRPTAVFRPGPLYCLAV